MLKNTNMYPDSSSPCWGCCYKVPWHHLWITHLLLLHLLPQNSLQFQTFENVPYNSSLSVDLLNTVLEFRYRSSSSPFDFENLLEPMKQPPPQRFHVEITDEGNRVSLTWHLTPQRTINVTHISSNKFSRCHVRFVSSESFSQVKNGTWELDYHRERNTIQIWRDGRIGVMVDFPECFGRTLWNIVKPSVTFPGQEVEVRARWSKEHINEYFQCSNFSRFRFALPQVLDMEMMLRNITLAPIPGYSLVVALLSPQQNVVLRIAITRQHTSFTVDLFQNMFTKNWVTLTENRNVTKVKACVFSAEEVMTLVYRIRVSIDSVRVSCKHSDEDITIALFEGLYMSRFNTSLAIEYMYTWSNSEHLYYNLLPSSCPFAEGSDDIGVYNAFRKRWIATGRILSTPQKVKGRVKGLVDGFKSGQFNQYLNIYCSFGEENRNNNISLTFATESGYTDTIVVLYQISPEIDCDHFERRNLEGGRVFLDGDLVGEISSKMARKRVIILQHFEATKEGLTTLTFVSGPSGSITLCEIELYGNGFEETGKIFKGSVKLPLLVASRWDMLEGDTTNSPVLSEFEDNTNICLTLRKYDINSGKLVKEQECCTGNQSNYHGHLNTTISGKLCNGDKPCRNAGAPYWIAVSCSVSTGQREYCAVSSCLCEDGPCTNNTSVITDNDGMNIIGRRSSFSWYGSEAPNWDYGTNSNAVHGTSMRLSLAINYTHKRTSHTNEQEAVFMVHKPADFLSVLLSSSSSSTVGFTGECLVRLKKIPVGTSSRNDNMINILLCPDDREAYVRTETMMNCIFSKRCTSDPDSFQACGCPGVVYDKKNRRFKTMICKPLLPLKLDVHGQKMEYMAVRSDQILDGVIECADGSDEELIRSPSQVITPDTDPFTCIDGSKIKSELRCNAAPDCTRSFTYTMKGVKRFFYEDEVGCNHTFGLTCHRNFGSRTELIWIPPVYYCDEFAMCTSPQKEEISGCGGYLTCPAVNTTTDNIVFNSQRCDLSHDYCRDSRDKYNCSVAMSTAKVTPITCKVRGYPTLLTLNMECDGIMHCDDGEDEYCLRLEPECQLQVRFKNYNRGVLWGMLEHYPSCHVTSDLFRNSTLNTLSNTTFIQCPDSTTFIKMSKICNNIQDCPGSSEERTCSGHSIKSAQDRIFRSTKHGFDHVILMEGCSAASAAPFPDNCTTHRWEAERGFPTYLRVPHNMTYKCENINGPFILMLQQLGLCRETQEITISWMNVTSQCPINSSTETTIYTTTKDTMKLVTVFKDHSTGQFIRKFQCQNGKCIPSQVVCDNVNDCGDYSDERWCLNKFQCNKHNGIPYRKFCDGSFDCAEKVDECNEECRQRSQGEGLLRSWERFAALFIGVVAVIINLISIYSTGMKLSRIETMSGLVNDTLVCLIAVGDLLVGLYMLLLFIYHHVTLDTWCEEKYTWKVSPPCTVLGLVSTFGSTLSLLSMVCLSVGRVISIRNVMILSVITKRELVKVLVLVAMVILWSTVVSVLPVVKPLEDYFTNGLLFESMPLFPNRYYENKTEFLAIVQPWGFHNVNASSSWAEIKSTMTLRFRLQNDALPQSVGFYGSDDVCLFKYFATRDNPQWGFVMAVLVQNLLAFCAITTCYAAILHHSLRSSRASGRAKSTMAARLQRKITFIIATDFATWIPFIMLSMLYSQGIIYQEYLDMIYGFCSLVLLPINSVINPIIYNGDTFIMYLRRIIFSRRRRQPNQRDITMRSQGF